MKCQTVKVKGGLLPFTILELLDLNYELFESELSSLINQMPGFFNGAPVVLGLEKIPNLDGFNAQRLFDICRQLQLKPVAYRGQENQKVLVEAQGYAFLNQSQQRRVEEPETPQNKSSAQTDEQSDAQTLPTVPEHRPSKVITQPVRSGQQIYVPAGDLIIMSNVSEAAEVMADGHIHIYGTLRGRALAGVSGDQSARIFCQRMEAQLISVAGYFKLAEDFQNSGWGKSMQARLIDETLLIEPLIS